MLAIVYCRSRGIKPDDVESTVAPCGSLQARPSRRRCRADDDLDQRHGEVAHRSLEPWAALCGARVRRVDAVDALGVGGLPEGILGKRGGDMLPGGLKMCEGGAGSRFDLPGLFPTAPRPLLAPLLETTGRAGRIASGRVCGKVQGLTHRLLRRTTDVFIARGVNLIRSPDRVRRPV